MAAMTAPFPAIDWNAVVADHGGVVWQTAWRLLGHESDAADCFQNTFLAAVKAAQRTPVDHWPAFLKKLATARAIDLLRARMRDADRRVSNATLAGFADRSPSPHQVATERELGDRLRAAIVSLPHLQAQVFCLVIIEGLSHAEVAGQLQITANHVGVLVHRARVAIRVFLEPTDILHTMPVGTRS
jgi:RNA polymerase sigma-70 factor (ECF subfamily)